VDNLLKVQVKNKSRLTGAEFNERTCLARNLVALISLASLLMPQIFLIGRLQLDQQPLAANLPVLKQV
jgi:hypothetical protein